MSADDKSLVGQVVLGRYRVLRRLALGGMGAVYLARTEGARGFSKPVVIKRILPKWGGDEEIVSLFAREARILSQLQDPGIVSVMDFGPIADGTLVMVLDYVHGYHLAHWLAYLRTTQGRMPVEMAVHIMIRVLSALHYAHTFVKPDGKPLAVIHRDVSPANILLDVSGHVKLVDFGIARAEGDEYQTEAPQLRGKFGYLAPELFTGVPPTPQSDVYAAGVTLYELLTGDNPFRGRELTESYHKVLHVTAPVVSGIRDDVTERLSHVIDTALAKDPSGRYASAAEFADALRRERAAPDEVCQARLRSAVQAAFAGPLAETLGVEPLSASDEAWREATPDAADQSLAVATHEPPPPVTPGRSVNGVVSPPPPQLTAAASLEPEPRADATLRLKAEPSVIPPPSLLSPLQLRWVAVLSMVIFGSLIVAGVLRSLDKKEDHVIVIEREASASAAEQVRPAAAELAITPEPDDAQEPGSEPPVGPAPALLTSTFAQRQAGVQACFASHAQGKIAPGDIKLTFHVAASGAVDHAQVQPDQVGGSALGACLAELARGTRFPRLTHAVTFQIPIYARVASP